MNGTLPLFDDLPTEPRAEALVMARKRGGGSPKTQTPRSDADRHLRAAWRLSRSMWRFRDRSPEQTRAGLAICHHLQALLDRAEEQARS